MSSFNENSEPTDPEAAVLKQLKKIGSNLNKLHPIEFFFYFPTKKHAESAMLELTTKGFSTYIADKPYEGKWCGMATKDVVPDHYALVALREEFTALAEEYSGEYDGWGTPTVE